MEKTRHRETLSFLMTAGGSLLGVIGLIARRRAVRKIGGGLLFAVGVAGLALTWHHWSLRTGHHMSIRAFLHPLPLDEDDKRRLMTHSGQLVAGALLVW